MTVSLRALGVIMILLGLAVLLIGRNFPGVWVYTLILEIFGLGLFVRGSKGK